MAEISDPIAALDFDLACSFRLMVYDKEIRKDQIIALSAALLGAKVEE